MTEFFLQKKELIMQVYNKAKNSTTETSFSGILKDLEFTLLDEFGIPLSYKTFETYYKNIVEKNIDYKIKTAILNDLSFYLGHINFKEFCGKNPVNTQTTKVKVSIDGNETSRETKSFSDIIINITNSPVFTLPEFVAKHSNSFGLVGILLVLGFVFKKYNAFSDSKNTIEKDSVTKNLVVEKNDLPHSTIHFANTESANHGEISAYERKKECMYWDEDHYEEVFCNEIIEGKTIIAINNDTKLLKKINSPDTLTAENALGKVWYDKSNKKVTFFTHYGLNPENGKTLKPATEYILETYAKK